jgi:hypothetical protein
LQTAQLADFCASAADVVPTGMSKANKKAMMDILTRMATS